MVPRKLPTWNWFLDNRVESHRLPLYTSNITSNLTSNLTSNRTSNLTSNLFSNPWQHYVQRIDNLLLAMLHPEG